MPDARPLLRLPIRTEQDIVHCRQSAKRLGAALGWSTLEQIRVATAVSELARNIYQYAGGGHFDFDLLANSAGQLCGLGIQAIDQGPGIAEWDAIRAGSYRSATGMGVGLIGAQRLLDDFRLETSPAGTHIRACKYQSPRPFPSAAEWAALGLELQSAPPVDPYQQIRQQSDELLITHNELQLKHSELGSVRKIRVSRIIAMTGWRAAWQSVTNSRMKRGS